MKLTTAASTLVIQVLLRRSRCVLIFLLSYSTRPTRGGDTLEVTCAAVSLRSLYRGGTEEQEAAERQQYRSTRGHTGKRIIPTI